MHWRWVGALAAVVLIAGRGRAQLPDRPVQFAGRGPAFFERAADGAAIDARSAAVFKRTLSLDLNDVSVSTALAAVQRQAGVRIVYAEDVLPPGTRVTLQAGSITLLAALTGVLQDAAVDVELGPGGILTLVQRRRVPLGAGVSERRQQPEATGTVAGRVTDAKTGDPVANVTVVTRGGQSHAGAETGLDGRYVLRALSVGRVEVAFRRLGYATVVRTVDVVGDSTSHVDVGLVASALVLDQVVTTVTGDQRLREMGNTIATIQADDVVGRQPVTTLSDVINARAAGVQVFVSGGLTGTSPSINIRGQNSFTLSNQPLLYVDGVRIDNSASTLDPGDINRGQTAGGFNSLSPDEIESIEIVKGPSAATLYGTDAANGVILVRTKQGTSGKPHWTLFAEQGALTIDRNRFPLSYDAFGHTTDGTNTPVTCTLALLGQHQCVQDSVTSFSPLRDPTLSPLGTGNRGDYGAQVSASQGDLRYFFSGSYESETSPLRLPSAYLPVADSIRGGSGVGQDILHPNAVTRVSLRGNVNAPLGSTATLGVNTAIQSQQTRNGNNDQVIYTGEVGSGYRDAMDGYNGATPVDFFLPRHDEDLTRFTGSVNLQWRPTGWLSAHAITGLDFSSAYFDDLAIAGESVVYPTGLRSNSKVNTSLYTADVGATASASLGFFDAATSVGAQYNRTTALTNIASATVLSVGSSTVAGGEPPTGSENTSDAVVAGAYVQEQLSRHNSLFVTGAVRADGGSSFESQFNAALYPKASVSWVPTSEAFWPRVPGVDEIRLRLAYGASGVQPPPTARLALESEGPVFVDNQIQTGAILGFPGNPTLKPERQTEFEGGADVDLFARRVHAEWTYYTKKSSDALVQIPVDGQIGGYEVTANIGSVWNWGYEALLTTHLLTNPMASWDLTVNGSVNHNQLLHLAPGVLPIIGQYGNPSFVPGFPLYARFDDPILSYADKNGDGIIESNEVVVGTTPRYIGPSYPPVQVSVSTSWSTFHNSLHLSALIDRRSGFRLVDVPALGQCQFGVSQSAIEKSTPLAQQAACASGANWGYYENGSFTRLREVALTYDIPVGLVRHMHVRSASVTLSGRNLALWTAYKGVDPEVNSVTKPQIDGAYYDQGTLPPSQYYIVRLTLGL